MKTLKMYKNKIGMNRKVEEMLKKIKNIPKKILIPIVIVGILGISTTIILSNLENLIEKLAPKFINGKVKIENIDLSLSNTQIQNIKLYDENNSLILDVPKIDAKTSIGNLVKGRIDEIDINSAKVYAVRDKDGIINFTKLSKTKSESKPKNPVDKVVISNLEVNYEDYGFENKLERKIENINAEITSTKAKLVDGANIKIDDKNINLTLLFNDKSENDSANLDLKLKIDKFLIDKDLLTSLIKNNPKLHLSDFNLTSDLTINTDKTMENTKINGDLNLNIPYFRFDDIDTNIKNINLSGNFAGQDGTVKLGMNIFEKDKEFVATYKDKEFNSTITFDRLDENILNRIVPIREKHLDLKNIKIEDIKTVIHYSDEKGFLAGLTMNTNNSEIKGLELKDFKLSGKSKNGKNEIEGKILTKIKDVEENLSFNIENEKKNTDVSLSLKSSLKEDLIPNIDLKAKLNNQKNNLNADIKSNIVDFKVDYQKKEKLAKIYGDSFVLNYDVNAKNLLDGKGRVNFAILNLRNYLDFIAENNKLEIKELKLADAKDKNKNLMVKGNIDLNNGDFGLDYIARNLTIDRNFGDKKVFLNYNGQGEVKSKNKNILSQGKIENLTIESLAKIDKFYGDYTLKKIGENIDFKIKGGIDALTYDKYKFKDFILDFAFADNKVKLSNFSNEQLKLKADYSLKNQQMAVDFDLKKLTNEDIGLDKVKFISEGVKAKIQGTIKQPQGFVNLGSTKLTLKDGKEILLTGEAKLKDTKGDGLVKITTNDIKLPNISLKARTEDYSKGIITLEGLDIIDKKYGELFGILGQINLKNKTINIKNRNSELNFDKLQNILGNNELKGLVNINLLVRGNLEDPNYNLSLSSGEISIKKYKIENILLALNGNKDKLNINHLDLSLYKNKIKGDGFIDLSKISTIDKENIIRELPYKLHLLIDDFKYNEKDIANIRGNSDIVISNEKIYGDIVVKEGTVYDIPNDYKSVLSIVKAQLAKKKEKSSQTKLVEEQSNENRDIQKTLNKLMPIDLRIFTVRPVVFNMDNFNIAVPELYGKLSVDVSLKGQNGKYYLDGETELDQGYMSINTNEFTIDRLAVIFNANSYLPKINPNIFFKTRVEMDDDEYRFDILGQANNLRYNISSKNGKTGGDLSALIKNPNSDKDIYSFGDGNEVFLTFMKNLIAGQLAQATFGPTTRYVKRKLDMTKLVIKPEITVYSPDKNIGNSKEIATADAKSRNPEIYSANIKLEAKDNIYKDKLFWKADVRLLGSSKEVVDQTRVIDSKVRDYDLGLEYKIDENKTVEVGAGTVPDKYRTEPEKNYRKTNYHVGYKIRKRYNNFKEIFSF